MWSAPCSMIPLSNRISIEDVQAKDGRLRLMENVWWEYDKLPHMLIAGGTGGGKTYFILTLIEALLRTNAVLFVLDPKKRRPCGLTGGYAGCVLQKGRYAHLY